VEVEVGEEECILYHIVLRFELEDAESGAGDTDVEEKSFSEKYCGGGGGG